MIFRVFKSSGKTKYPGPLYYLSARNGKRMMFIDADSVYFDNKDASKDAQEMGILKLNFVPTDKTLKYDLPSLDRLIRAYTQYPRYFCSIDFDTSVRAIKINQRGAYNDDYCLNILDVEQTEITRAIAHIIEHTLLPMVRQLLN